MSGKPLVIFSSKTTHLDVIKKLETNGKLALKKVALNAPVDIIMTSEGLAIKIINSITQIDDSRLKKIFKHHIFILNCLNSDLIMTIDFQHKCQNKGIILMYSRNDEETGSIVEKLCFDLFKVKEETETLWKKTFSSIEIQKCVKKLPITELDVSIVMEVFGNLYNLSQANAEEIMERTPLSEKDALSIQNYFLSQD